MEPIVVHLDPEIRELIPDFMRNRRRDVSELLEAVQRRDVDAILRIGHSLKGVGGGFGFEEITDLGREIELAARESRLGPVHEAALRLRSYLDRVRIVFDSESC